MKTKSSRTGLVLQGYFRIERFRGAGKKAALLQPKASPPPSPRAPRPELLPPKMRRKVGQPKTDRKPDSPWSGAPRPELLPGMGPTRIGGPRRAAQARSIPGVTSTPVPAGQLRVIGEGRPLEPGIRQAMESFFGADFSGVRVHEGPAAQAMGALAFTLGEELHFAPGLYDSSTREGVELLGHELTHVVQQRDGRVANPYGHGVAIVQDPALEAEADRMGQEIAEQMWSGVRVGQPAMATGRRARAARGAGPSSTVLPRKVRRIGLAAQRSRRRAQVVDVNYVTNTHEAALLEANVQHVSTFFHANRDLILPKGLQSILWSPYIEFNIAKQYGLGARVVYDVEDRIVYLAGHYDDGGDYERLLNVPKNVLDSLEQKVLWVLQALCVGTKFQGLSEWTVVGSMGLLLRSLAAQFKKTGSPV